MNPDMYWKTLPEKLLLKRLNATLDYCEPHLDKMWAAYIIGQLLGCDFRDAKEWLADYKSIGSPIETTTKDGE